MVIDGEARHKEEGKLKKAYICSPYRAGSKEDLERNLAYARELTLQALKAGLAPVTPHLYIAQCLDEGKQKEREMGMAAGLELLGACDFLIAGIRYGISEGMGREIAAAEAAGMDVVNADKLHYKLKADKLQATVQEMKDEERFTEYARNHACDFCRGNAFHTCTSFSCAGPFKKAYEYAEKHRDRINRKTPYL